ncbi:MAG: AAA family ATPase [Pseudomonadota bacterium]
MKHHQTTIGAVEIQPPSSIKETDLSDLFCVPEGPNKSPCVPIDEINCDLIGAGASLHWLHVKAKNPVDARWSELPNRSESGLRRSYRQGQNIGIRLGQPSQIGGDFLHLVDLDIRDASKAGEAWAALLALWPAARGFPSVVSGSGGESRHLYFLSPVAMRKRKLARGDGWEIDLMGTGSQAVLPPSIHPKTGQPYRWERPFSRDMKVDPETLARLEASHGQVATTDLSDLFREPADRAEVRRALALITDSDDRDQWLKIGMALHADFAGSDEGFDLWSHWSRQSLKFDERDQRQKWKSFRRSGVGIGTLFEIAKGYGYERPSYFSESDFDDLPALPEPEKPKPSTLTFLTPDDCESAPSRGYLIKGLFAPGDVACIFGAPGAGKSLIAPFLGYMVAQGQEAFQMRTKAGGVFYVAAEDSHGMRGRVKALKQAHGSAQAFRLVEGASQLLTANSKDHAPDLLALVEAVKAERPALIFIDTLAMAFPGLEENSAEAMGRVVAVSRLLTRWGAAVVLIHHDTKSEGGTPRGHSLLNGALDVALHVKRDDEAGIIRGKLTKNRNGTCDRDIAFTIATENGGADEDGEPITLPRCNPLHGAPAKVKRLPPSEQAALDLLEREGGTLSEADFKEALANGREASASDNPKSRRDVAGRAIKALVQKKRITFNNGIYSTRDGFDDLLGAPLSIH